MPINLKALRTVYVPHQRREYRAGDEFSVLNDKEARRLVRSRRAELSTGTAQPPPAPQAAPVTPRAPAAPASAEPSDVAPFQEPEPEPEVSRPARRYRRRDMKAGDNE